MIQRFNTENAPTAIGPYSQASIVNGVLYSSGQIALIPSTGELLKGSIQEETEQVMQNLKNLLEDAGSGFDNVIKTTVFIKNMDDFGQINEVYGKYFGENRPSRSCVEVARLPKDVNVEIEVIALVG